MDLDCTGLRRSSESSIQWVVLSERGKVGALLSRVAFSSRKEALVARKEANCYWWESYCSFSCLFSCIRHWFMEVSESEGRSPINLVDFLNW